jgi:hypothetical protein
VAPRIYSGEGIWILVPDCLQPPLSARDEFGPLRYVWFADMDACTDDERAELLAQFDLQAYAVLTEELALRLRLV